MKTQEFERIEMLPSLKRDVLACIFKCKGKDERITKQQIASLLHLKYGTTVDRQIRLSVNELRKEGHLILSDSGGAGYWYASSYDEVNEVVGELKARAGDLLEQSAILLAAAEREYSSQLLLI